MSHSHRATDDRIPTEFSIYNALKRVMNEPNQAEI